MDLFVDRAAVASVLTGKEVAIVGSGPGSNQNELGFIDSHEVIVRVNNYGRGAYTGGRTDVWYSFFGSSIRKKREQAQRDGVKLCMCKCPNAKPISSHWHESRGKMNGIDFRYIYRERAGFWFCPTYIPTVEEFLRGFELLGRHVPTTGFAAILDVLSYEPRSVFLTGFDFFTSGIHNMDERWRAKNNGDPIGHAPILERAWLMKNAPTLPITMDRMLIRAMREAA